MIMKNGKNYCSFCLILVFLVNNVVAQPNTDCLTPNQESAKCIKLTSCSVIFSAMQTRNRTAIDFAKLSYCGHEGMVPLVCCGTVAYMKPPPSVAELFGMFDPQPAPQEPFENFNTSALPDRTICGLDKSTLGIWGGEQMELNEFPWMVALEFKLKRTGEHVGVRCGGSLISSRFVLTAAHCIKHKEFQLTNIRLGEWNIETDPDCVEFAAQEECADEVVKVEVEEIIVHPFHSGDGYDIALLKLVRDVQYTDYIRPICLPPRNLPIAPIQTRFTVAGWGVTENNTVSNSKLEVQHVPLLMKDLCKNKMQGKFHDVDQMCAGGSCKDYSGGPLMRAINDPVTGDIQWYQEGIVSAGVGCAHAGYPAVYTRVDKYINWILAYVDLENGSDEEK